MKIANIIEEGRLGGPQIRIVEVAKVLKTMGIETTVIFPIYNSKNFHKRLLENQINFHRMKIHRLTKDFFQLSKYFLFFIYEIFQIYKFLLEKKFELIHISGGAWQFKGVLAAYLSKTKVVWHLNDTNMPIIIKYIFKIISINIDGFIFASKRTKKYYSNFLPKNKICFNIPAPVDTTFFSSDSYIPEKDKIINTWEHKIVIGTVANINPLKNIDLFLNIAIELKQEFKNLLFVIIGASYRSQDRYYKYLLKKIELNDIRNFIFLGQQNSVRKFLHRFDIYCCTSISESSPIAVWEAMSMSKAIVSTDVGDVPQYVKNGFSGEIINANDESIVASFSKKIKDLVIDENKRTLYAKNAREIAIKNLDLKLCAKRHKNAYNCLV